jgi:ABC-type transport system substrate-binding protein
LQECLLEFYRSVRSIYPNFPSVFDQYFSNLCSHHRHSVRYQSARFGDGAFQGPYFYKNNDPGQYFPCWSSKGITDFPVKKVSQSGFKAEAESDQKARKALLYRFPNRITKLNPLSYLFKGCNNPIVSSPVVSSTNG